MKNLSHIVTFLILMTILAGCQEASKSQKIISYAKDVAPILQTHCLKCHNKEGEGYKKSGLNMESYTTLMSGTKFGPIIEPGNSLNSTLVRVINAKTDPAIAMPHGGMQMLTEQNRTTIADWIDQGAADN